MTTFFHFRRAAPVLVSCWAALLVAGWRPGQARAIPPEAAQVVSSAAEDLSPSPGQSLEREIRGGETRLFGLRLNAGTFFYFEISPKDLSLSCRLLDPDGKTIAFSEGPELQLLAAKLDRDGSYRLEVTGQDAKISKRFRLRVLDLRAARSEDDARVAGAALLAKVRHLSRSQEKEAISQAISVAAEALAAWRRANDPRGEFEALLVRGGLQHAQGDLDGAVDWYGKALLRAREGGLLAEQARALINLGACQVTLTKFQDAVDSYLQASRIWDQVGGPFERAFIRQSLANCYLSMGDFETALRIFEEERPIAEASGDLAQQGRMLTGLGAARYELYELERAHELWEQALSVSRQAGDEENVVITEQNMAALYYDQGQLQRALDIYARLGPKAPPQKAGLVYYNTGLVYLELGNLDSALESFELSRAASKAVGNANDQVQALIGIGRVRQRKGDPRSALAEYQKAQGIFPTERWDVLYSVGLASIDLGLPKKSLEVLEKALALAVANRNRSQESVTCFALGLAHAALGQRDAARENLDRAITTGKQIGHKAVVAPALLQRALLSRGEGRLEMARADIEDALQVVEATRRSLASDQLRLGFFATRRTYYDLDIDLLLKLDRSHPEQDQYRALAFEAGERSKARGLLDLLAEGRIDLSQGIDPDLRARDADLSSRLSGAQRRLRAEADPEKFKKLQVEVRNLENQRQQLDLEIRTRNPRYAGVQYPVPLKLQEIRERILDDRTALLEYSLGAERSDLFVITRKQILVFPLPAAHEIADKVRRLRGALERESLATRRDYLDGAYQLYKDLVAPASVVLADHPNLLIVPDGALHYVPFEALLVEPANGRSYRDLPYFLRGHSIVYIPSASVLAGLRETRQEQAGGARQEIALFAPFATAGKADVRPGAARASAPGTDFFQRFEPLPASLQEVSEIAGLYPGTTLELVGEAASEKAFKNNPGIAAAGRLHLATHAQINEEKPELSALISMPGNGEDGYLDVREIFGLKLAANLAVLSACETGLGQEVTGEGLIGLTRAFFYAGVPSLVVSLWNVVDGSTPDLMRDFYRDMDQSQDKAKALQSAKLAMIGRGEFAYPTYWAPFILLGEPR